MFYLTSRWCATVAALLIITFFCPAQADTTAIELGAPGLIVLPGSWDMVARPVDLLDRFEVEFHNDDSTSIGLVIDRRDAFAIDTVSSTAKEFVIEFFKIKKRYSDDLGHWSCNAVLHLLQDRSSDRCVVWRIIDDCGTRMIGLYGADDVFVYDFSLHSSTLTEDEQVSLLVNAFHSIRATVTGSRRR